MPPTGLLGRGGVFLVIDLPVTAPHGVERVTVLRESRGVLATRGPQITVLPNRERAPRSFVWLTQPQWEPIEALRQRWCASPPVFRALQSDEPFYDVAVYCPGLLRSQRLAIPVDQLPDELQAIIDLVPSPMARHRDGAGWI